MEEVAGVKSDAKEIRGNEAELSGADADNAHDGAIDRGNDPALPEFAAQEDRAEHGQETRDVIQSNGVKHICPVVFQRRPESKRGNDGPS